MSISYATLEALSSLTAVLTSDSVTAASYQWYRDGQAITGEAGPHYTTVLGDVGRAIHVVVTGSNGVAYISDSVTILPPQISVTVPIKTVVTVNGAGACSVPTGSISNNTAVDVYVTEVAFAWKTTGSPTADDLFSDYTKVTATLTLGTTPYSFTGASPAAQNPTAANGRVQAMTGATPGTLDVPWAFALGTGNYIKLAMLAGEEVQAATITYTIGHAPTP